MEFVVVASVQIEVVIEAPTQELAEGYVEGFAYAELPHQDKPKNGMAGWALGQATLWQDVDVIDVAGVDVTIDSTEALLDTEYLTKQAAESGLCGPGCGAGG